MCYSKILYDLLFSDPKATSSSLLINNKGLLSHDYPKKQNLLEISVEQVKKSLKCTKSSLFNDVF